MNTLALQSVASCVKRILVVDDKADNLFLLQTILETEGYLVEIADSSKEALLKIETAPPDLILLDVMMPEMDGYELARHIRQNTGLHFLPILMVTGCDRLDEFGNFTVETDGLIHKPIDLDYLLNRVSKIFAKTQPEILCESSEK
jgi:CheY-like chemotaxis protein